jgi:signal transduction histidine kinase
VRTDRPGWVDTTLGVAVGLFGLWEMGLRGTIGDEAGVALLITVAMGLAAGTYRVLPSLALGLVWSASVLQVATGRDVALVQLATIFVAYGTARYGRPATLWASGLSIPVGAVIALVYVRANGADALTNLIGALVPSQLTSLTTAFLLVLVVLSAPWGVGLILRLQAQFRDARAARERAEIDTARAQEVATLRADQARLARDVHDVVGHSLTVILAQADSVAYMEDADIDRIRAAVTNISASARRSLGDVRQVLSSTNDPAEGTPRPAGGLDSLLEGVSGGGNDVRSTVDGTPQPLPPELDVVAFRVLQEMLTNALKHGRRGAPIEVGRLWGTDYLRIQVRNAVADGVEQGAPEGLGATGMRRRLEGVGGRLEMRQDDAPGHGRLFTATAWVPVRPGGSGT